MPSLKRSFILILCGELNYICVTRNGIVSGVFGLASWLAPSLVVAVGTRLSMILAALTYLFNTAQYLYLNQYSVYISSVILGLGAPVIWTAQALNLN